MTDLSTLATILRTTENNVPSRLINLKIAPVCSRCGGTGNYSFNQMDGSRCFGCGGTGHVSPKPSQLPAMIEAANECVANGKLDLYIRSIEARKMIKTAIARVFAAWTETTVCKINEGISHMVRENELENLAELRAANYKMCDAYRRASKAVNSLDARSPTYVNDVLAAETIVNEVIATIAAADYDVPQNLVDYSAAKRAEYAARRAERGM